MVNPLLVHASQVQAQVLRHNNEVFRPVYVGGAPLEPLSILSRLRPGVPKQNCCLFNTTASAISCMAEHGWETCSRQDGERLVINTEKRAHQRQPHRTRIAPSREKASSARKAGSPRRTKCFRRSLVNTELFWVTRKRDGRQVRIPSCA